MKQVRQSFRPCWLMAKVTVVLTNVGWDVKVKVHIVLRWAKCGAPCTAGGEILCVLNIVCIFCHKDWPENKVSFADIELWLLLHRVTKLSISRLYFSVNIVSTVSVDSLFLTGIYSLSLLCSPVFNCPIGWQQREGGKGWLVRTSNQAFVQPGLVFCVPCCICELDPPVYVYVVCF